MPFKQLIDENKMRVIFSKPFFDEVSVELLGDFNDWQRGTTPLKLSEDGEWLATVDLESNDSYRYVYLVNDFIWHSDPDAEDFVEGPYGEEASMISTSIDPSFSDDLHLQHGFLEGERPNYKKVLLPFDSWYLLDAAVSSAIEKAKESSAELILLRLSRDDNDSERCFGQESIFSILRGLQSQLQQLPIKVSVDTAVGIKAKIITKYAKEHDVDLIVISDDQVHLKGQHSLAEKLTKTAVCATEIIRPN